MQNAPSGIAQLRISSQHASAQHEPMNLDDFIFADNAATPISLESPQATNNRIGNDRSGLSMASAIPIKSRKDLAQHFVPQSVPVPALHQTTQNGEFNYVNRHQRKTSIDDRRVSLPRPSLLFMSNVGGFCGSYFASTPRNQRAQAREAEKANIDANRHENALPTFLLKSPL